jgi:hypothetical protein
MSIEFKGSHFERHVNLWGVRWYVAYPISYRQPEEMMEERGVEVDHSTLNRWVLKYAPLLEREFRGFCRKFPWCASSHQPLGRLTPPANRIAAPDAIRLSSASDPYGSCARVQYRRA